MSSNRKSGHRSGFSFEELRRDPSYERSDFVPNSWVHQNSSSWIDTEESSSKSGFFSRDNEVNYKGLCILGKLNGS